MYGMGLDHDSEYCLRRVGVVGQQLPLFLNEQSTHRRRSFASRGARIRGTHPIRISAARRGLLTISKDRRFACAR
jgi:hypothetical protein